ncbi:hypothetical protein HaLaN_29966, partial [Haematococcus lacustris]
MQPCNHLVRRILTSSIHSQLQLTNMLLLLLLMMMMMILMPLLLLFLLLLLLLPALTGMVQAQVLVQPKSCGGLLSRAQLVLPLPLLLQPLCPYCTQQLAARWQQQ